MKMNDDLAVNAGSLGLRVTKAMLRNALQAVLSASVSHGDSRSTFAQDTRTMMP